VAMNATQTFQKVIFMVASTDTLVTDTVVSAEEGEAPSGKFDVITLDTNIFTNNGYNLDGGLLAQLTQFKGGAFDFVLSEVIVREIIKHIGQANVEERQKFDNALKAHSKRKLFSPETIASIEELVEKEASPLLQARVRVNKYLQDTGAKVISADGIDVREVIDMYFRTKPPFEPGAAKKSEFPDAIALLSLDKWARENDKKILAVSRDKGWHAFARQTPYISVVSDLAEALSTFQDHLDDARTYLNALLAKFESNEPNEDFAGVERQTLDQILAVYPIAEGESYFTFEDDGVEFTDATFGFLKYGDEYEFSIVRMGVHEIVARIPLRVSVTAEASFSFSVYDEGYINIGGCHASVPFEFESAIIVTLNVDLTSDDKELQIDDVELVDIPRSVYFGSLEPDYSNDYDEHDFDVSYSEAEQDFPADEIEGLIDLKAPVPDAPAAPQPPQVGG
jgi:hypothetical protein